MCPTDNTQMNPGTPAVRGFVKRAIPRTTSPRGSSTSPARSPRPSRDLRPARQVLVDGWRAGAGLGLAGLIVVLVGLDQDGQDSAEVADVAGGQGLDEVAADPVGVRGPGLLEALPSGRGERDVELAAVGGADRAADQAVAFHPVQQPGDAAAAKRVGD